MIQSLNITATLDDGTIHTFSLYKDITKENNTYSTKKISIDLTSAEITRTDAEGNTFNTNFKKCGP